jgi:DNA-binding LacI/PurR family transcriptional regulator
VDDVRGGRLQAEYLAGKGHRRVRYLCSSGRQESTMRRQRSFIRAACDFGMEVTEQPCRHSRNGPHVSEAEAGWLDLPPGVRPTAAVCWNDVAAYDLLEQCQRRGLRVPEELAIVGFDGVFTTRGLRRRLTTVRAPWQQVGQTAIVLLANALEGETIERETVLPVALIVGETA